ncbi:DUF502 domain-containing protein [Haloparvum sp. PAK95]|uniref:DUF502 domain-containing protein n=1 Tax=Haloparvum sp. PAK95 TaxID=3418962 RepID=UPI003D2F0AF5
MADDSPRIVSELRNAFLTGVAVIVPLLITLIVLAIAFNYIYVYLDLFSDVILPFSPRVHVPHYGVVEREVLVEVTTPLVLLVLILLVGLTANSSRYGELAVDYFDYVIERIPGIGSVYQSFRQMSDVMIDSETENFQDVVLVEYPTDGSYTIAFVTSETPQSIAGPVGESDMKTLFMPMAPNPVMGGYVIFVREDRVVDVDLTVEEGIRALVTSGVALTEATGGVSGVSESKLREISMIDQVEQRLDPGQKIGDITRPQDLITDRPEEYDENVDPERARTADSLARREREEPETPDRSMPGDKDDAYSRVTPAERAGRYESEREPTERPPDEAARDPDEREPTETEPERAAGRDPDEREPTEEPPEHRTNRARSDRVESAESAEGDGESGDGAGSERSTDDADGEDDGERDA